MAVTGASTSILYGPYRLSVDHYGGTFETAHKLLDVQATLENAWSTHLLGSRQRTGSTESYMGGEVLAAMRTAMDTRASYPVAVYRRGAGLGWVDVNYASVASLPDTWEVDTVETRVMPFGFTEAYAPFQGVVYDYSFEDGSTGVTGIKDGPWYQIGALASGETYRFSFFNAHYPAPDITTATCLIRSASDGIGTGATTQVTLTAVTSTASYQVAEVAGPVTDAFWQLSISALTGNVFFPVLVATRID